MKRRDILKSISLLPLSGSLLANSRSNYRTANFTATRNKTKGMREPINIPGGPPLAT